jgi:hypothetical protein
MKIEQFLSVVNRRKSSILFLCRAFLQKFMGGGYLKLSLYLLLQCCLFAWGIGNIHAETVQLPSDSTQSFIVTGIEDIQSFLERCPTNDPVYNLVKQDFEILVDGQPIAPIICNEPISAMPIDQYTDEIIAAQTFRTAYYMSIGTEGKLPWTQKDLYSWMASNISGVNIKTSPGQLYCCDYLNGKYYFSESRQDNSTRDLKRTWPGIAITLDYFAHEIRHSDAGAPGHTYGCIAFPLPTDSWGCDATYDLNNLGSHGVQYWLESSWATGYLNIGISCAPNDTAYQYATWNAACANNFRDRFVDNVPPIIAVTQPYGGPCVSDGTPPTPNPMTWATAPNAASSTSIQMVATTATDSGSPPVSYYFHFSDSPTAGTGGSDSVWQSLASYTDSGLQPNHRYGYQVRARDSATTPNETSYSSIAYKYTLANAIGTAAFFDITPNSIGTGWTANGNRSGTEYYCENITKGTDSGWTTNTSWNSTGLDCNTSYSYRVKARNGDGIETAWTSLGLQSTTTCTTNYTLSCSNTGNGSVKVNGTSHTLPWSAQFTSGTNVQIEAVADSGWSFTNWTGDLTGSTNPATVTMSGNKNVTAIFSSSTPPNNAAPPKISISPTSVNLGSVKVGASSVSKKVTIKNTGKSTLEISSINITGNNASEFNQTNDCTTIPVKGSCSVMVSFTPAPPFDKKSAAMNVLSNDPKKPTVSVKLSGQAPLPKISVSPTKVNFTCVGGSSTSTPKTVKIKNTGTSDLVINSIVITGANADEFSQTNDCTTIPSKGSCTATLTFVSTTAGKKTAIMVIDSNDPKRPTVNVMLNYSGKGCGTGGVVIPPVDCNYMPHSLGSSWTYNEIEKGSLDGTSTYEITESSGNNIIGTLTFSTEPGYISKHYQTISNGVILSTKLEASGSGWFTTLTDDPPVPSLPICLTEDASSSASTIATSISTMGDTLTCILEGHYIQRVIGRESVSVPAGTFPDAFKVESISTVTLDSCSDGSTGGGGSTDDYGWYVNGVGVVKTEASDGSYGTELISYTIK